MALDLCARVHAWMHGRDEVAVTDIKEVIHDVFRHRIIQTEHAKFNDFTNDKIIDIVLSNVPAPEK